MPKRVLDLFSGKGGWAQPARHYDVEIFTVDINPAFKPDLVADILTLAPLDLPWRPDFIFASPPCEAFSVASIGHHWGGGARAYEPKTDHALVSQRLVTHTRRLVESLDPPQGSVIENPRGVLRKLGLLERDPVTVWQCHYGSHRAKPTDLWVSSLHWQPREPCHNKVASHEWYCCCSDHEAAPRGARTGTQGDGSAAERAVIPYQLAESFYKTLYA